MIRVALLSLAIGCAHGACRPAEPTANSTAADIGAAALKTGERAGSSMSELEIVISSDAGPITAKLEDNEATRALVRMLPLTIEMSDHLRQEKTGSLPSSLPGSRRQTEFSAGMLGLWGNGDFVIYYRNGSVPRPGIIVLGRVTGDVSMFDRAGSVTVRLECAD